ncbi:MAG: polysaccharide biosynthesis tyrosine autokinase, partial [Spartobacteria bacterium]|nr:polysaccharide biosynthesis tyrosine autokinase [Spartobacteria bacterium]
VMMMRQVPVYRAKSSLLLSKGLPVPSRLRQEEIETLGDYIITQQRIVQSPMMAQRAMQRMGRPEGEVRAGIVGVNVYQEWKTSILSISVDSLEPVIGAEYANALAEEYIAFKSEERLDTSQATVINLTQQANRIREELDRAEARVLAFKKENKVVAIEDRGNIAAMTLAGLSRQAAMYRTERMLLEAQQPMLREADNDIVLHTLSMFPGGGANAYPLSSVANIHAATNSYDRQEAFGSELVQHGIVNEESWVGLKREKARKQAELAELRKRYRDAHPKVKEMLQRIDELDASLRVELQFVLQQYNSMLKSLEIKEMAAHAIEREWEDEALEVGKKADEYQNLQRNVDRLRGLYNLVFNRLKEVDISIGIEPESVRIMERAKPAGAPMTPRKLQNIFIAALIGLGIGLGLVFGLEYIDDSLRYPDEVTKGLGLPFFGVVPAASWDPDDLSTHLLSNFDQKSGLAEAYRNIRSSLLFSGSQDAIKTLVISSAVPREGKTTTSLNLAVSLAQAGTRVLLVDADMRRGELHKFFGLDAGRGLSDVLTGQTKPESVIQHTRLPNLDLIATGPFPPNPAELVLRPEMGSFMEYAKRTYDRVLFDCPPLMAVSEAGITCSLVDGVIFVVWAGQTSRKLAQLAVQVLRERGAAILGCVLNNLEFGRVGYYYYSTYYGYYDYEYRYEQAEAGRSQRRKR